MKTSFLPLAAVLVLAVCGVPAVSAQVVTPVPAPTIITTAPYTISKPGYYQLGANLTLTTTPAGGAIITINASNVVLDFAGHYISGPANTPGTALTGVLANERGNLTIRNGTITFCVEGIQLIGNGNAGSLNINQHIDNMLISYCYYIGVNFYAAKNSEVSNCRFSFIGGSTLFDDTYGVYISPSKGEYNQVNGNTVIRLTGKPGSVVQGIHSGSVCTSITNNFVASALYTDNTLATKSCGIYANGFGFASGNRVYGYYVGFQGLSCQNNMTSLVVTTYDSCADGGNNL